HPQGWTQPRALLGVPTAAQPPTGTLVGVLQSRASEGGIRQQNASQLEATSVGRSPLEQVRLRIPEIVRRRSAERGDQFARPHLRWRVPWVVFPHAAW